MKKTLIIILTTSFISSQLASNEIYKTNNESVYLKLLSRFECVIGPNINKPSCGYVMKKLQKDGVHFMVRN